MIRNRLRLLAWGSLAVVMLAVLLSLLGYNLVQNEKARYDSISQLRRDAISLNVITLDLLYNTAAALQPRQWFKVHEKLGSRIADFPGKNDSQLRLLKETQAKLGDRLREYLSAHAGCSRGEAPGEGISRCRQLLVRMATQVRLALQDLFVEINRVEASIAAHLNRYYALGNLLLLALLLTLALLTLFLVFPMTRKLDQGLGRLMEAARRFSKGDLDYRLAEDSGDELGVLSRTFNEMANRRRKAERELSRKERWLSRLLETIPYGVQENDLDGVITYSNPAHHRILGRAPGELVGCHIWDFLAREEEKDLLRRTLRELVRNEPEPRPVVNLCLTAEGREVQLEINWDYLRDETGRVTGFISIISDVTERIEAEEALKKSEASLAQAQRVARIGSWELDLRADKLWWSAEVYRIFEIDPERFEASYEAFLALVHPDDRERVHKAFSESLAARQPYDMVHRLLFEDGRVKYVHERSRTYYDEAGKPIRSLGTIQDITQQQLAEKALREREQELDTIIENLPVMVFLKDARTLRFLNINRAGEKLLGISREQLIGKKDRDIFPRGQADGFIAQDRQVLESHQTLESEGEVIDTPGGQRHLRTRKVCIRDDDGNPLYLLGISEDITEKLEAQRQLEESQERYRQLFENMSDGVAIYQATEDGKDFVFIEHNPAAERITGYTREEVLGKRLTELFPGSEEMGLLQGLQRVWRTGRSEYLPVSYYQDARLMLWAENYLFRLPSGEVVAIYQDITARKRAEEALQYRLTIESALAVVSRELAQASEANRDELIDRALAHIGKAVNVDRSYMFLIDEGQATFSNTHEWCAEGIRPQKPELQQVPLDAFEAAFRRFSAGEALIVSSPGELGEELASLKQFMEETGIRSLLNVPIRTDGRLLGVVGFDAERAPKSWPEEDVRLLQTVAENFTHLLLREEALRRLREHAWYLEGLDRVSSVLAGGQEQGKLLEELSRLVLDLFDADRAWFLCSADAQGTGYRVPVEVTRPEYPGIDASGPEIPDDEFGRRMMERLLDSEEPLVMQMADVPELPEYLEGYGIRSQMLIALRPEIGDPWIMGIHQCSRERHWNSVERRLFRAIAERASLALATVRLLEQVRDSERRLQEAEQIASIGTWELDLESGRAFWSEQEYRCLGYEPYSCEAGYESFAAAVHPDDLDRVDAAVHATIAGETEPYDIRHRVIWQDGSEHVVRELGIVERDETGKPVRMIGTTQDITERVQLERELEAYRQHLEQLVEERTATIREQALIIDQTHDAVVTVDMEGRITGWNRGAEKVFGYGEAEAKGEHISLVYPAEQLEFLEKGVIAPLKAKGSHETEVTLRRKDGDNFPAHLSLSLLHDEAGNPKGMVGYTVDISEIKRRESELQELAAKLEASNRELESFSYSVSHDLRAPLRAIDGFSLALMEDYHDQLDETAKDYLERVRGGAQRMGALIDDLLQLSRVNRGEIQYQRVDLSELADAVIEDLRAGEPDREVHFDIEPGMEALGDPRLLKVVIANLLENAWKFTSREPHATIRFRKETGRPGVFYIQDNGVGFDMRHADKLFGAFQRLHRTTDFPGTGVGLATVQRILHRHGGQVWAEAEPGKGATFHFSLRAGPDRVFERSAK